MACASFSLCLVRLFLSSMCVRASVRACMRVCVRVCMRVCVRVRVRVCVCEGSAVLNGIYLVHVLVVLLV